VGQRVARLLVAQGATVRLASRQLERAQAACRSVVAKVGKDSENRLIPLATSDADQFLSCLEKSTALFSCGAAGQTLIDASQLERAAKLRVAIDLNAVPPAGIEGIAVTDKAVARGSRVDYGAIGVGGLKMKIHRESIATLFTRNDLFLDAEEILEIGKNLEADATV
jgi:hypothetical protein